MCLRYWLCWVALVTSFVVAEVEIVGEISFDIRVVERKGVAQSREQLRGWTARGRGGRVARIRNVTRPEMDDCVYQFPEKEQLNALLSNMLNQLASMYVRLNKNVDKADLRQAKDGKRFKVVGQGKTDIFSQIYSNMTQEYHALVNMTGARTAAARERNPCEHQEELRSIWRTLLDNTQESLRRAALACVESSMPAPRPRAASPAQESHAHQAAADRLVRSELARTKVLQLHTLCDQFQLCYNDLL